MRDVKKVLEMRSQNYSQRQISVSLKISRDTIRKIFNVADDKKVCWSSVKDLSESDVQNLLFEQEMKINLSIKQPDFDYIHKELLKPGTTIKIIIGTIINIINGILILADNVPNFSSITNNCISRRSADN